MFFIDRRDAGLRLGRVLREVIGPHAVVVYGLPRGGMPVAYEVAQKLHAPLDVLVVRKLGVPGHEELAMGAVAPGGVRVLNDRIVHLLGIPADVIEAIAARELEVAARRERAYRGDLPREPARDRDVVVVDDGLATGASMRAAVRWLKDARARRITAAVPVGSPETCEELRQEADEVVCLTSPEWLHAVGQAYQEFSPTTDDEVRELVHRAASTPFATSHGAPR
jgi:predicted phosphoribosyltransferase